MRGLACLLGLLLAGETMAALPTNAMVSARSASRQFLVQGVPLNKEPPAALGGRVRVDPSVLAVSCERIKEGLLRILGAPDRWQGKIQVVSRFTLQSDRPVHIRGAYYSDGWQYRMDLADEIETNKLVRGVVQVLLMEMANRQAGPRSAEIPLWLTEGMSGHLEATSPHELVPRPFSQFARESIRDPASSARARFVQENALTFNELSLPTASQLEGERWVLFQASAQLFVGELLKLPDGQRRMVEFIQSLSGYLNWQLAFLQAYRAHFGSLLDVEKWWALRWARMEGENLWFGWSQAPVWDQWEAMLRVNALVSQLDERLPANTTLSLQRVIEWYDFPAQRAILQDKVRQLTVLRARSSPKVAATVDAYRDTLLDYVRKREEAGYEPAVKGTATPRPQVLIEQTIRKLDELDRERERLRRQLLPQAPVPTNSAAPASRGPRGAQL